MMEQKKEVKVGDLVNGWNLSLPEYDGCEFKAFAGSNKFQITKVPERKPEVPGDPKTRGAVVTIEGDDDFIAIRFSDDEYMPFPYLTADTPAGPTGDGLTSWDEIVEIAAGCKITVHKTVDTTKAPLAVETYEEWLEIPWDARKKYKWQDRDGDIWRYDTSQDTFVSEGEDYGMIFDIKNYLPLTRNEKIG